MIHGFFDPANSVKFSKLKNLIFCDSLTYIRTNSYRLIGDNFETLQFLAILCTRISHRKIDITFFMVMGNAYLQAKAFPTTIEY